MTHSIGRRSSSCAACRRTDQSVYRRLFRLASTRVANLYVLSRSLTARRQTLTPMCSCRRFARSQQLLFLPVIGRKEDRATTHSWLSLVYLRAANGAWTTPKPFIEHSTGVS